MAAYKTTFYECDCGYKSIHAGEKCFTSLLKCNTTYKISMKSI